MTYSPEEFDEKWKVVALIVPLSMWREIQRIGVKRVRVRKHGIPTQRTGPHRWLLHIIQEAIERYHKDFPL